jgi:hypothetical protein
MDPYLSQTVVSQLSPQFSDPRSKALIDRLEVGPKSLVLAVS